MMINKAEADINHKMMSGGCWSVLGRCMIWCDDVARRWRWRWRGKDEMWKQASR